jgi:Ca2+-binding RTX toxin-like protein
MAGFGGNDLYYVDNGLDRVIEGASEGTADRIFASVSYTLGAGVYVETLSTDFTPGTAAINLTGNELVNTLFGNAGANSLDGKAGADTMAGFGGNDLYYVDNALDRVIEGASEGAADRIFASVSYTLGAGVCVETLSTDFTPGTAAINLTGNELVNTLFGNAGANSLDGKTGADTLAGFAGNDFYYVDNAADRIIEGGSEGTADRAFASVSYTLGVGVCVETLSTTNNAGTGAIDLTGNELVNTIFGNAGANILDGKAGADTLAGMGGTDQFNFTSALGGGNVDRIVDLAAGDRIALDDAIFAGIGTPGAFSAAAFVTGSAAADANDRVVYNQATGQLFYDADGNGAGAAILFATLDGKPALAAADFMVI